jgi:plasmid stabilization system protein ParE
VRRLVWTDDARLDLDNLMEFHARTDRRVGEALVGRIETAAVKLRRRDTGRPGRIPGTREKSVPDASHIIVYEIHDNLIIVFRIIHAARHWRKGDWPPDDAPND